MIIITTTTTTTTAAATTTTVTAATTTTATTTATAAAAAAAAAVATTTTATITTTTATTTPIQRRYSRFFTISSKRRELSPSRTLKWPRRNRVQITCNTSSADHVQHVVSRAIWYEGTAQLLSLTELKSHLFELYFVG